MMHPWFTDAKLGIFIHWGIYSAGNWSESWAFFNGQVPYDTYMAQAGTFTAERYDPDAWADLFVQAGAKYAVLTAKHHDGFALWPTRQSKLNVVDGAPAGRDLVGPYCAALRRRGLKVGIYFSQLDWSHPDYATIRPRIKQVKPERLGNRFAFPQNGEDPQRWERFLQFHRAQLRELCESYQPDLLWFDGDWERDPEQWRFEELRRQLHEWCPHVVLNSRMGGYGDYRTPEQAMPIQRPVGDWEFCVTIGDAWGYHREKTRQKSVRECVRMLAECAGMGGNLLLDAGPKSDGTITPEQTSVLRGLGRWAQKHAEALYGTGAGLPHGHFYGASTLSKDRRTLYLFHFDRPNGGIAVKGIRNKVLCATVLGDSGPLSHRRIGGVGNAPGVLWIDVPDSALDADATVIKVELDGELDLFTGPGRAITQNP